MRSYRQFCALARTLDVVGERWTLLVLRELLLGPRRFRDLLDGLPGIGANLLTARLRHLEAEGLIAQEVLPPPAPRENQLGTSRMSVQSGVVLARKSRRHHSNPGE